MLSSAIAHLPCTPSGRGARVLETKVLSDTTASSSSGSSTTSSSRSSSSSSSVKAQTIHRLLGARPCPEIPSKQQAAAALSRTLSGSDFLKAFSNHDDDVIEEVEADEDDEDDPAEREPPLRWVWKHHDGNPLDFDTVIVDEASMVGAELAYRLVRALK